MKKLKTIPKYAILPTIALISLQFIVYFGTQFINKNYVAYDFTISFIDDLIPVATFFILFYILCYPWWVISPLIVSKTEKTRFYNWALALMICYLISALIFIIWPTTITRPIIENNSIFDRLTNFIYLSDSPERPINLFPSFHCLISWYCYIGVRNQKNISLWYRISALVFSILVCLSTQFVKQHYIVDLIGAIIIAEVVFFIVQKFNLGKYLMKINLWGE